MRQIRQHYQNALEQLTCSFFTWVPVAVLLAIAVVHIQKDLKQRASYWRAATFTETAARVRRLDVSPDGLLSLQQLCGQQEPDWLSVLTAAMLDQGFLQEEYTADAFAKDALRAEGYRQLQPEAFSRAKAFYNQIFSDVVCFPVGQPRMDSGQGSGISMGSVAPVFSAANVSYEDSWMFERNFGGKRGHEGTDLFPEAAKRDVYPVVSMTDGVVEAIGWLTKGGYRIGVRAPGGGYFYYAHLSSYAKDFQPGDAVTAGDVLGYMGDTGYGEEGTVGKFPVHLHVGIYVRTNTIAELAVNPYPVLKYVEQHNNF